MFEIILACTKQFGIGSDGILPWYCLQELQIFKKKTKNCILIVGRKTLETLPKLKDRKIICVSASNFTKSMPNIYLHTPSIFFALQLAKEISQTSKIFIIGGAQIYNECFTNPELYKNINNLHISFMKDDYECDTYIKFDKNKWLIESEEEYKEFTHYIMKPISEYGEIPYLKLLEDILQGSSKYGRNGLTYSKFVKHLTFDLEEGFPLLTTKSMFFRGILEEFLFFIKGETDTKKLEEKGINIWKGNTSREFLDSLGMKDRKEGMMGPMYGYQWRFYGAEYDEKTGKANSEVTKFYIDQIKNIVQTIKTDPSSRRILLSTYNPIQASQGVLYPCHTIVAQFYVEDKHLSMFCFNRSQDLFLGTPFNIASSALLLTVIAKMTNMVPKYLHMTLGDTHIYSEHLTAVKTQIDRQAYTFPKLTIKLEEIGIETLEKMEITDFVLENYRSHALIKAKMVV